MIPADYITEWRLRAPWAADEQVEQDLILSRALAEIFSRPELAEALAFRGGTALYKLCMPKPLRYSEDIDLVQRRPEPIGTTLDSLRFALDPWLGSPRRNLKEAGVSLVYRMTSENLPAVPLRLKVEINTREQFSVFGIVEYSFEVDSRWFSGSALIPSFALEELLGDKAESPLPA